jgi:NAD+ kinase
MKREVEDKQSKPLKSFGLFLKWKSPDVVEWAKKAITYLKEKGCEVKIAQTQGMSSFGNIPLVPPEQIGKEVDCILTLGGDGTMLMAAKVVSLNSKAPIIGIHLGRLGFLTQIKSSDFEESVNALIEGRYRIKTRDFLKASVWENGKEVGQNLCLNEVVVHRETIARVIDLRVFVDDTLLSCIRGDGLIIATPLGSTAYSLSAGGPILHPHVQAMTLTALAPHTLTQRPVVIPDEVEVRVEPVLGEMIPSVQITLDGQEAYEIKEGQVLTIKKSGQKAHIIDLYHPGKFFLTLQEKLHWGI